MAGRRVHFSLSEQEVVQLRAFPDDDGRSDFISKSIETEYFENHRERLVESDKAWDAMHRALADEPAQESGSLGLVVLDGEQLCVSSAFIISLKTPAEVAAVARRLPSITEAELRARYDRIDAADYEQDLDDEDFEYIWENFDDVRVFWLRAAEEGRFVIFTVDL